MSEGKPAPVVAQKMACAVEPEPGQYLWCACGRSSNQPYCDGSHVGTGIAPLPFTMRPGEGRLWLCGCKHSRTPPLCDDSHNKLPD